VGPFSRHAEVDAAVAALPVCCPHVDSRGADCLWCGRLGDFDGHEHLFTDQDHHQQQQQQQEEGADGEQRQASKRRRSADDDDDDDDDAAVPQRKVSK